MRRGISLFIVMLAVVNIAIAQIALPSLAFQKFSADTVKRSIDDVTKELSLKHPGFYRYTSKKDFDRYIDSVKLTITDSLTELQAYRKLKLLIGKINCLHTGLALPKEYNDYLNDQPNLFPFQLYCSAGKVYIAKNYSGNKSIAVGDELISINGQPVELIIAELFPYIPSDGNNLTLKYRALNYSFSTWYRGIIELTENFAVVIKQNNVENLYQVKGARFNDIAEDGFLKEPARPTQLEFKVENNIGFLTIHSFAKTDIKKAKQDFKEFIAGAFKDLRQNNVQQLIIDLRDNSGGSDPYAALFTSYFFDKPFRYWSRIEVTEAVAKEITGLVKAFYKKPVQQDSIWLWQKGKHTNEFDFYEEQKPAKNNYTGKTYILINGFCMSSCADVVAILSYNKKAIFIGEETGGGYQGNNSGMIPQMKLLPFNFTLSVPLQEYYNYVDTTKNNGRGTIPDYPIANTIDDVMKGSDKPLNFTMGLVQEGSR